MSLAQFVSLDPVGKNEFVDTGEVPHEKLNYSEPTPRRRGSNTVNVVCDRCGHRETISYKLFPDPFFLYVCQDCTKKQISAAKMRKKQNESNSNETVG